MISMPIEIGDVIRGKGWDFGNQPTAYCGYCFRITDPEYAEYLEIVMGVEVPFCDCPCAYSCDCEVPEELKDPNFTKIPKDKAWDR